MSRAGHTVVTQLSPGPSLAPDRDPATTEVVRQGLNAVADQMKITLCRTAVSPEIFDMVDFAAGVFDPEVRLLAQARALPQFLGTLSFCAEGILDAIGGAQELRPGDVLWSTDGFVNGSHPQDAVVLIPVFHEDALVGLSVVKAHHADIAAKDPYSTDTTDVFQEGAIFPGVRLFAAGVRQDEMWRTVLANTRMPTTLSADLEAQIAATRAGERGLARLIARFGVERFRETTEQIFAAADRSMRRFLSGIPDGRYRAESWMDNNGIDDARVPFSVAVEIAGDCAVVDFTDCAPEQGGPVNCPLPTTVSTARLGLFALLPGGDLPNEGHFRAIEIRTRTGTLFHPLPPAPIFLYGWAADNATEVLQRALAEALPNLVPAGSGGDLCTVSFWGRRADGEAWTAAADHAVGHGATHDGDATGPLIILSCSGIRSVPTEVIERNAPVVVEAVEFAPDSAGAGAFRGGLGVDLRYRVTEDVRFTAICERTTLPSWGVHGGADGRPNAMRVRPPAGDPYWVTKTTSRPLPAGAVVDVFTGGGGGYGPPAARDRARIEADIEGGYVSRTNAERDYPALRALDTANPR